ncbi:MAG: xanthine dehydrogenase family protein subunit M [Planctomycetes bacterium]|nr:xanthine dehydrogenase family protein subunit M [Planctomycetota bacterium]
MKAFELLRPASLEQALELLPKPADRERVRVVAGGQDLYTEMKDRLIEPDQLLDLKRLAGFDRLEIDGAGNVTLGALLTLSRVAEHAGLRASLPLVGEAALSIASTQIRNVGTVGGNLNQRPRCWYYRHPGAHCLKKGGSECFSKEGFNKYNAILGGGPSYIVHPSDLAPALVAAGAEVVLAKKGSSRTLPLEQYYTLPRDGDPLRETVLGSDEILTHVRIPAPAAGWKSTYLKFKERGSFDFALASVAAGLVVEAGVVRSARLVLGGVAPIPWRAKAAEEFLAGKPAQPATWREAAAIALSKAEPLSDNEYKVALSQNLIERAFTRLTT